MTDSIASINQVNRIKNTTEFGKHFSKESAKFAQGEVVVAKIVEKNGDSVTLDIGGKMMKARQEGASGLFVGMSAEFEVLRSDSDLIVLKAHQAELSEVENKLSHLVKKEISDLGLDLNPKNIKLLLAMHANKMPISVKIFQEFQTSVNSVKMDLLESGIGELSDFLKQNFSEAFQEKVLQSDAKEILNLWEAASASSEAAAENPEALPVLKELIRSLDDRLGELQLGSDRLSEAALSKLTLSKLAQLNAPDMQTLIDGVGFLKSSGIEVTLKNILLLHDLANGDTGLSHQIRDLLSQAYRDVDFSAAFSDAVGVTRQEMLSDEKAKLEQFLNLLYAESSDEAMEQSGREGALSQEGPQLHLENRELLKAAIKLLAGSAQSLESKEGLIGKFNDFSDFAKMVQEASQKSQIQSEKQHMILSDLKGLTQMITDNQHFVGMVIPNFMSAQNTEIEFYVNKESLRSKHKDSTVVYLALSTHHLEQVRVRIEHKKTDLKIDILCKSEEAKIAFEKDVERLKHSISKIYPNPFKIEVHRLSDDLSFAQLHKKENLIRLTGFGIDARV